MTDMLNSCVDGENFLLRHARKTWEDPLYASLYADFDSPVAWFAAQVSQSTPEQLSTYTGRYERNDDWLGLGVW